MARKKKNKVVSHLSVAASGGYVAGANVEGQEGSTPAGLVNNNSEGLVSASQGSAPTAQPTEVKASGLPEQIEAKVQETLEKARKVEAQEAKKVALTASLDGIDCKDNEVAMALVNQAKAQVEAGEEVHASLVAANVRLKLAESRPVPSIALSPVQALKGGEDALTAALCSSYGIDLVKAGFDKNVITASRELGHMSVRALAHHSNLLAGGEGLHGNAGHADIMAALSTASTATLLANLGGKRVAEKFESSDAVAIVRAFTKAKTVNDFKTNTAVRLGVDGKFAKLAEGEEIPLGKLSDANYTYKADMHGRRFGITRQMIYNDDLGLLMDLQDEMILGAEDALVDAFLAVLANTSFFSAGNGNLDATGAVPSEAGYTLMDTKFAAFTRDNGRLAGIKAKNILVPSALQTAAKKMFVSTEIRDTTVSKSTPTANVFQGTYEPSTLAELPVATTWYGFADPQRTPAIVASYLEGRMMPTILPSVTSHIDLSEMTVGYFDFGMSPAMKEGAIKFTA
jgi:hypothetical protein